MLCQKITLEKQETRTHTLQQQWWLRSWSTPLHNMYMELTYLTFLNQTCQRKPIPNSVKSCRIFRMNSIVLAYTGMFQHCCIIRKSWTHKQNQGITDMTATTYLFIFLNAFTTPVPGLGIYNSKMVYGRTQCKNVQHLSRKWHWDFIVWNGSLQQSEESTGADDEKIWVLCPSKQTHLGKQVWSSCGNTSIQTSVNIMNWSPHCNMIMVITMLIGAPSQMRLRDQQQVIC